jgi:hypothetical protein
MTSSSMCSPSSTILRLNNFIFASRIAVKYVEQARSKIEVGVAESDDMSVLHRILQRDPSTKRAVIAGMDIILAGVDTVATLLPFFVSN